VNRDEHDPVRGSVRLAIPPALGDKGPRARCSSGGHDDAYERLDLAVYSLSASTTLVISGAGSARHAQLEPARV
jgi:hypothetical protein